MLTNDTKLVFSNTKTAIFSDSKSTRFISYDEALVDGSHLFDTMFMRKRKSLGYIDMQEMIENMIHHDGEHVEKGNAKMYSVFH